MDTNDKIDISTPIIEKINSTVGRDRKGKAKMNAIQYKNVKHWQLEDRLCSEDTKKVNGTIDIPWRPLKRGWSYEDSNKNFLGANVGDIAQRTGERERVERSGNTTNVKGQYSICWPETKGNKGDRGESDLKVRPWYQFISWWGPRSFHVDCDAQAGASYRSLCSKTLDWF